jgi:hypothetical protein
MLVLTSPTSNGRSVGIVHSRSPGTEFVCLFYGNGNHCGGGDCGVGGVVMEVVEGVGVCATTVTARVTESMSICTDHHTRWVVQHISVVLQRVK